MHLRQDKQMLWDAQACRHCQAAGVFAHQLVLHVLQAIKEAYEVLSDGELALLVSSRQQHASSVRRQPVTGTNPIGGRLL